MCLGLRMRIRYNERMQDTKKKFDGIVASLVPIAEPERRIKAFKLVRDIPYGNIGSRSPYDVLEANKGTCSGKHALLKLILEALGYEVQSWFALHDFSKFPITPWPSELEEFHTMNLPDYHDFLKVRVDGKWVVVDAIFDKPLKNLGFPVQDWDGISDMKLPVQVSEVFKAEGQMEEDKKRLIAALPQELQVARKKFLEALTRWLDEHR